MYATAAFEFNQNDNGWLMAEFAFVRSLFLIFLFPHIISWGRRWTSPTSNLVPENDEPSPALLPTSPGEFDVTAGEQVTEEPVEPLKTTKDNDASHFDLVFLRWSLVVDGALTTVAAFATRRWHIYLGT